MITPARLRQRKIWQHARVRVRRGWVSHALRQQVLFLNSLDLKHRISEQYVKPEALQLLPLGYCDSSMPENDLAVSVAHTHALLACV